MKVAILQMNTTWHNIQANMDWLKTQVQQFKNTNLLLLPETFLSGFTNNVEAHALTMESAELYELKALASENNVTIAGSLIIEDGGLYYNRFLFWFPNGSVQYYDKRHLFSMSDENKYFSAGTSRKVFDLNSWRILPQVCYDLRFPVFSRNNLNYDVAIYTANWPAVRDHVWQALLKARAIENQCYVVGVNRIGCDPKGIDYLGNSMCVDPRGNVIAIADKTQDVLCFEMNKDAMMDFRKSFPVLNDMDGFSLV